MANNRLGRGFAALVSDMREIVNPEIASYDEKGKLNQGVNEVAVDLIHANPHQPRKIFNQDALNELADSIKTHGILQPIVLTKFGEEYRIVAGERRFRAAKIAGLATVPAIIRDLTEQEVREIALVENLQREDLNPMEEAEALYNLLTENNLTQEALAHAIGKSRPAVANALRLLTLPVEVQAMVRELTLSTGHAKVLVSVKPAEVQIALAKEVLEKKLSVRDLEQRILDLQRERKVPAARVKTLSPEFKALLADMQRVFGTKVKAMGSDKKGKIVIDYYSSDDLQRIFDLIERLKED